MPLPNKERNKRFKNDVEKGLSITELAKKYRLSPRQISRLKKKLTPTSKPAIQQPTKPTIQQYEKATFYLYPGQLKDIKRLALEKNKNISELAREILRKYLKNKL